MEVASPIKLARMIYIIILKGKSTPNATKNKFFMKDFSGLGKEVLKPLHYGEEKVWKFHSARE